MAELQVGPFGHEPATIDMRRVLYIGAILAVSLLVVVTVLYFVLRPDIMLHPVPIVAKPDAIPPARGLPPDPDSDLATLRAKHHALLSSYAWMDSTHAIARIPIERAMTIYVQEHAPQDSPVAKSTVRTK